VLCAVLFIFVVRPVSGIIGLVGYQHAPWRELLVIIFFGVRGIGSLYYLSYALNEKIFPEQKKIGPW